MAISVPPLEFTVTVGTTEWSFGSNVSFATPATPQTTDGILQAWFDLSTLVAGDQFQFRIYEKVLTGSTQRVVYEAQITGAQPQPILVLPSLTVLYGWDVTVKKILGTDRSIIGSLRLVPL